MMVGLYYVIPEMSSSPMSVANNFCDLPLPKYLDSKTVESDVCHTGVETYWTAHEIVDVK
jgi:hypothetical protein